VREGRITINLREEVEAVLADRFCPLLPIAFPLREPILRKALSIAEKPLGRDLGADPVGVNLGQDISGVV
jgi:hypothetical protein